MSQKEQKYMAAPATTTIFDCIRKGDLASTKQHVLKSGHTKTDGDGWSPLELAAVLNKEEIAKYLIDAGADINFTDPKGASVIHQCAWNNSIGIATALLEKGADLHRVNDNGSSPLSWAAGRGHLGIVRLLCAFGAKLDKNKNFKTALDLANEKGFPEVADYLTQYQEKLNNGGPSAAAAPCINCPDLKKQVDELQTDKTKLEKEIEALKKENEALKSKVNELENRKENTE